MDVLTTFYDVFEQSCFNSVLDYVFPTLYNLQCTL